MYCISCGAELPDDAHFCAACGAKVYTPPARKDPPTDDAAKQAESEETEEQAADQPPRSKRAKKSSSKRKADKKSDAEAVDAAEDSAKDGEEDQPSGKVVKNPAMRQGSGSFSLPEIERSGSLNLPEIDPSQPMASVASTRDGRPDDIAVSPDVTVVIPPGPFKPSYGPLSPADLFEMDGTTAKMPRIQTADGEVLVEGDAPAKNYVQSNTVPKRWTPGRVVALSLMGVVAVALAIAAVQLYGQRAQEEGATSLSQPAAQTEETAVSTETTAESTSTESEALAESNRNEAIYQALSTAYDQADELNDRLADAVDDYNTYYVASDASARQSAADRCNQLAADIAAAQADLETALEENECAQGDAYYDQAQDQRELLDLLAQRVAPLVSSWEISVASESPTADESAILAPLREVDSTTLANEFDALYATAAPTRESA